jgi:hypothetical protein
MTDADYMIHITQRKLKKLIRKDTPRVCKPKQTMIRKDGSETHGPGVQYRFMT